MDPTERTSALRQVAYQLGTFARQVELKRALESADRAPQINFWRMLYGGLSNLAVIEWCKLFGSEGSNDLHWKRLYPDRLDEFRAGLYAATGTDAAGFQAYWREMKRWRDTNYAHHQQGAALPAKWPQFDIALAAAEYYYDRVVAELGEQQFHLFPSELSSYRRVVRAEYDGAAALALQATRHMPPSKQ